MNKQQLAAKIWESANRMRSKIEANHLKGREEIKIYENKTQNWIQGVAA